MAENLTGYESGFNSGILAAVSFHEGIANEADRCNIGAEEKDPALQQARLLCIQVLIRHRGYANTLRTMLKLTDAEQAEQDRSLERLNQ